MNREFEQQMSHMERHESPEKFSLTLEEVKKVAREGVVIPIFRDISSDMDTPVKLFSKLAEESKRGRENKPSNFPSSFLLESGGENVGRYSYICINPKGGIKVTDNEISELGPDGAIISTRNGERIDPLKAIQDKVSKTVVKTPGVPPFSGGYVGYLGYETVVAFEGRVPKSKPDPIGVPESMLFEYDNVIVFDHARNKLKIVGNINVGDLKDLDNQYREITSGINETVRRISAPEVIEAVVKRRSIVGEVKSNFTDEKYRAGVKKAVDYVDAGDAIQIVISQRFSVETDADPFDIYRRLREENPSPFMTYADLGNFQIASASPELLLQVEDGEIITHPIAGTRPRGRTPEEDAQLEEELKTSEKQRAEHIMLVDLARNDVGRVARPGTVDVTKLMEVVRFSSVMHMLSEVRGRLADGYTSFDALRAAFPAGTVSGAPKIRAMEIIGEIEPEKRGVYAGAIGHIDYTGNFKMAIAIRTVVVKDGVAYAQAGGGITHDSESEDERLETIHKTAATIRAIKSA